MKLECDVIRNLLPLYAEKLAYCAQGANVLYSNLKDIRRLHYS